MEHPVCAEEFVKPGVASFTEKIDVGLPRKAHSIDDTASRLFFHRAHLPACNDAIIADKARIFAESDKEIRGYINGFVLFIQQGRRSDSITA